MSSEANVVPERRPYTWLPVLILGMTIVAMAIGAVMLHSIEVRLVEAAGGNLTLASAEIADKLDRLLFERYARRADDGAGVCGTVRAIRNILRNICNG